MRIAKDLIGKTVLDSNANIIGKVIDVDFEFKKSDLIPNSLIVSEGGIIKTLNINKGELVIPWNIISAIGDKVILKDTFIEDVFDDVDNANVINDNFVNINSNEDSEELDLDKFEEEIGNLKSSF